MGKITHQQARNMLQASVDHPLSSTIQARLDDHLAECSDCHRYAEHLQKLENDLHRVMQERWHEQHANISIVSIQARSRRLGMRNTIWNSVKVLAVIALLATFLIVVNSFLRQPGSSKAADTQTPQESTTNETASPSPFSESQKIPIVYVVQQGDTLYEIAINFNVSIISIIEANNLKPGSVLSPGRILLIYPPLGESQITPAALEPRETPPLLFVQDAFCAATSLDPLSGTRTFIWPSRSHFISGDIYSTDHPGLDIAGAVGDLVSATDSGVAVFAGWNPDGFGNMVIIDHGDGWYSLYAHLDQIAITCGQNVFQGAKVGTFGNATATTLYFAVIYRSRSIYFFSVLPPP
jgi:LysM repeat protein